MVAPERQRQGLGEVLFRTWDRNVGASLGLGLSESSYRLFQKLRWPDVGPVPCLVKPLTRRAFRHTDLAGRAQSPRLGGDAADRDDRCAHAAARRRSPAHSALRRQLHRALGFAGAEVRLRGAARRRVPELEVRVRRRTCATRSRRCAATIATSATRSTGTSHEPRGRVTLPRRLPRRSRRSRPACDAARLGRSRGAAGRLRQDSHLCHARRLPQSSGGPATSRSNRRMEFVVKVNGINVSPVVLRGHRSLARHARRLGSGPVTAMLSRMLNG